MRFLLFCCLFLFSLPLFAQSPQRGLEEDRLEIITQAGKHYLFDVEIAKTPAQTSKGMMYRRSIQPFSGMLFLLGKPRIQRFWMKNTYVPLDIVFIRRDGVIADIITRYDIGSHGSSSSSEKVTAALEIGAGRAKALNIMVGDRVVFPYFVPSLD